MKLLRFTLVLIIWGQGLGLVTPFLLSPGTRGRAAANAFVRGLGLLRPGLPKSDPKYGARGRSTRRLVLGEKIAQPSGPYH